MNGTTRRILAGFTAALLLAFPVVLPAADAAPAGMGVAADLAFETGAFMQETEHAAHRVPPADWQAQTGALRMNAKWEADKALPWFVEDQQLGGEYVAAGLALGNKDETRWGLKVLEWGFAHMEDDGLCLPLLPDRRRRCPPCRHAADAGKGIRLASGARKDRWQRGRNGQRAHRLRPRNCPK